MKASGPCSSDSRHVMITERQQGPHPAHPLLYRFYQDGKGGLTEHSSFIQDNKFQKIVANFGKPINSRASFGGTDLRATPPSSTHP